MIERQFVNQKVKEYQIQEYIKSKLVGTGYSHTEIQRTPLGEKVIIYTTRPGLVVGRKGENIKQLTTVLNKRFNVENPQIEIGELINPMIDANYVADRISSTLVRFGSKRFKSVGYKTLQQILDSGALGAEIVISGKVPSARARSWRFSAGHLKKSGYISQNEVKRAVSTANLKSGTIGIKVSIMTPDIVLPDKILILDNEMNLIEKETGKKVEVKEEAEKIAAELSLEVEAPKDSEKKETKKRKKKAEAKEPAPSEEAKETEVEKETAKEEIQELVKEEIQETNEDKAKEE
ncbi:30S ribosomal protein S3 [Candidatus Woesearchaeota archaeon]|nr:30S ribosomal protein S3 [Candidatus Woesearchaeota archaeon]